MLQAKGFLAPSCAGVPAGCLWLCLWHGLDALKPWNLTSDPQQQPPPRLLLVLQAGGLWCSSACWLSLLALSLALLAHPRPEILTSDPSSRPPPPHLLLVLQAGGLAPCAQERRRAVSGTAWAGSTWNPGTRHQTLAPLPHLLLVLQADGLRHPVLRSTGGLSLAAASAQLGHAHPGILEPDIRRQHPHAPPACAPG